MVSVVNLVTSALALSALYALVAIGFTMIFGVGDILNIAHGAAIILGGWSAYYAVTTFGTSIWLGAVAAVLIPAVFSVLIYLAVVRPIEDDEIFVVIVTLVVLLITEHVFLVVEGTSAKVIPSLFPGKVTVTSVSLQTNAVFLFGLSWVLIGALFWGINRTWAGRSIRVLSMTERGSKLVGVNRQRTTLLTYFIAGGLAGLAGLFFGMSQAVSYNMGLEPLLLAFAIVILGGMGSIKGSVVGAYVIGSLETITTSVIDPRMTGIVSLVVLFLVLIFKPTGLFGHAEAD